MRPMMRDVDVVIANEEDLQAVLGIEVRGADVAGVVSFHGGLETPLPAEKGAIKAKVLVLHGADDPTNSPQNVAAFQQEMRAGSVDWQMVSYGGAVHAFTQKAAGNDAVATLRDADGSPDGHRRAGPEGGRAHQARAGRDDPPHRRRLAAQF